MSEASGIGETLSQALQSILTAIVNIVKGIADTVSANAGIIATVLVIGGLIGMATYAIYRYVPFVRGLFERFFKG